ncbi:MAG TPA: hypothetical protein VGB66_16545 [Longimicrobium sp.]|jgi:hypothetical protein
MYRTRFLAGAAPFFLLVAAATPLQAQAGRAGFLPQPDTSGRSPILYVAWSPSAPRDVVTARLDVWKPAWGFAAGISARHDGEWRGPGADAALMLRLKPQTGAALKGFGVQAQAGLSAVRGEGDDWSVEAPLLAGILIPIPPPLPGEAHGLGHLWIDAGTRLRRESGDVRAVAAGGAGIRFFIDDGGAGGLTRALEYWGVLVHWDVRRQWEFAVMRMLRR